MLLTLAVNSLKSLVQSTGANGAGALEALDVPRYAREELGLHGLNVPTWLLAGWSASEIERLRDVADKAACPCLLLVDSEVLELGANSAATRAAAEERFTKLTTAANRLGCNAIGISCKGPAGGSEEPFERTAAALKAAFSAVDRLELNVLLRPTAGMLDDPTRLTDLIKKVGGFRIGSLPDFGHANRSGGAEATLRKLAPYAGAIHATIEGFDAEGRHRGCDLPACVEAIRSVGYQNTLAIECIGSKDPAEDIRRARDILSQAISGTPAEEAEDAGESSAEGAANEGAPDSKTAAGEKPAAKATAPDGAPPKGGKKAATGAKAASESAKDDPPAEGGAA